MKLLPLRIRLTLWYAALFAVAQIVFGTTAWVLVRQHLYAQADHELVERMATAEALLAPDRAQVSTEHLQRELREEYEKETVGHNLQVLDGSGQWLYRSPLFVQGDLPFPGSKAEEPASASGAEEFDAGGHHFRAITRTVQLRGQQYRLEAALNVDATQQILRLLTTDLLLSIPILILIAGAGGFLVSRRALAPVEEITRTAQSIQETNLSLRLPVRQSGDEIEQLSVTLNEMLARIQHAFERTKQFTADASHELRTPVSLIRTEAEICLRRTRNAEEYRAALTHILNEAVRTSDLIETLLQLARADAGKAALEFQVIDARPLVEDVVEGWRSILEQSSLGISLAMPQEPVFVLAEAMALRRLLAILLDNARKYTPASGNIAVEVAGETDSVNIRVRDTGIGISPENIEHIFDRFFRADTVRGRSGGAGLGLSLAKWIVEQHSGRLMVESPAGQGSTFTVSLPRSAAATVPAENSPTKLNERSIS